MKLQILIPHYKEDTSLVRRQLDSIATQQGIDVAKDLGVIICNDGSDVLLPIDDFEKEYPFAIQYCVREHSGMSAIRSFLLKLATADYVMCCDSDDVFSNMLGLYKVFETIDNGGFDVFYSAFYEELFNRSTGKYAYVERCQDLYFLHGKVFRRQFLIDNKIDWKPGLNERSDNYFLWQAMLLAEDKRYSANPFYTWKYNPNSVCRNTDGFFSKTYHKSLLSDSLNVQNFIERERYGEAAFMFYRIIYDGYFELGRLGIEAVLSDRNAAYALDTYSVVCRNYLAIFKNVPAEIKTHAFENVCSAKGMGNPNYEFMEHAEGWARALITGPQHEWAGRKAE